MRIDNRATRAITEAGVEHRVVEYGPVSGLKEAALKRGLPIERVLKSLVVRTGPGEYMMVLVPGDRVIDWKKLRRIVGKSRMSLAPEDEAFAATGYPRGAITPFGSMLEMPLICDASIDPGEVSVGGGAHGVSIHLDRDDLTAMTGGRVADVTRLSAE